jgi:hypothetical protein
VAKGDRQRIGHIEGNEAFDLSGEKRCNYNPATGNLCDPNSGKIIGHVTLQRKIRWPLLGSRGVVFSKRSANGFERRNARFVASR